MSDVSLGDLLGAVQMRLLSRNTRKDAAKIDFDDDFIYREVSRPPSRRKIPMKQFMRAEALAAFQAWRDKADKSSLLAILGLIAARDWPPATGKKFPSS